MDKLWAPWRMEYINNADKESGCIFCRAKDAYQDDKYHVLVRNETCFAMLNKYPYNSGHLLIAPNDHKGDLYSLDKEGLGDLLDLTRFCQSILSDAMNPDGFNVGINLGRTAGAGVLDHVHIHIVPRWNGDTNFMPVIGDTKVIPQSLEASYNVLLHKLKEKIKKN